MNENFIKYFNTILPGSEQQAFYDMINSPEKVKSGFRVNKILAPSNDFLEDEFEDLEGISWSQDGYFYKDDITIGKTKSYENGFIYPQEPSSQVAVPLLDVQDNQIVLDMCASPGSKTSHIASIVKNKCFIVANEIDEKRAQTLKHNLRRFGVVCTAITSIRPQYFAETFPNIFDRVLVDAPCSGEGMFFKFPAVIKHWNIKTIKFNAVRQRKILDFAFRALKPGGKLVYSTCTLNLDENEKVIESFLQRFEGNAKLYPIDAKYKKLFSESGGGVKIWPHKYQTGGFFAAIIGKNFATPNSSQSKEMAKSAKKQAWEICKESEVNMVKRCVSDLYNTDIDFSSRYKVVKNNDAYYMQPIEYYKLFSKMPVKSLGVCIFKTENGTKKATDEFRRWLSANQ